MAVEEMKMRPGNPSAYPSRYDFLEKINEIIRFINELERRIATLESYH